MMSFETVEEGKPGGLVLELSIAKKVNFASSQNGVSVLKKLLLKNQFEAPLEKLTVELSSRPGLIRPKSWT
ncbi:hypothetical protein JI667_21540, partial [Bacillus sp. NTK074B]|uniref:hypothetical protein n=1 Tax=Bacillus sp. NTK074B TaxID=2802174 RepID=UPI001A8DE27D|nr:hypothetical protein [Bacillus sp. NTK074B]